ncbi:hypothetical protein A6770_28955 [Nostoc minutum NIES-26]|uniref:SEFIR domain-containing protein n=1 Tax=Nostoc minutum NIES-26 TaxID=1844469 RepID=A0A367QIA7_9NOSO|nr:hypothetical protein A6770_28955 [Nostoc minutum NIES-26]
MNTQELDSNDSLKVFISYSHDSYEHKTRVKELSKKLFDWGIYCNLDQYEFSPPEGWPRWMDKQIREADFVLVVCTPTYKRRFEGEEETGKGHGIRWEGHLTYQDLYNAGTLNTKFIPVLLESGKFEDIPKPLQGTTYYCADTEEGYESLYRHLTNQPKHKKPERGKFKVLPTGECQQDSSNENYKLDNKEDTQEQRKKKLSQMEETEIYELIASRMSRSEIRTVWFLTLKSQMDDDMNGQDLKTCAIELVTRVKNRQLTNQLIENIRKERPDLVNP